MENEVKPVETIKEQVAVQPVATTEPKITEQVAVEPVVAPVEKVAAEEKHSLPKGVYADLYKLREDRRKLKEENETLKRSLESNKVVTTNGPKEETPEPLNNFLDDPDKSIKVLKEQVKTESVQEALNAFRQEQAETKRIEKLQEEGSKTLEYILTQPEINGDNVKLEEVDSIIKNDPVLSEIVRISPMRAGKEAMEIWRTHKGMDANSKKAASTGLAAISSSKTTAMSSVAKRTLAQVKADFGTLHPNAPDYQTKYDSLMAEYSSLIK